MTKRGKPAQGGATERGRSGRTRAVADIVPDVGRAAFRRFGFVQSSVVSRWREIVGDRYAEATAPESIRFAPGKRDCGVLTLTVDSGFSTMVQHVAPEIVERVNRFFGYRAVERLAIRQGRVDRPRRAVFAAKPAPAPEAMTADLKSIADDGLRACLEALAARVSASEGPPLFTAPVALTRHPSSAGSPGGIGKVR